MSAIVSALDADRGASAKLVGIAELSRKGNALTVSLLNTKKKPVQPKTPVIEVRWIFLGPSMEKPEIVKSSVTVKKGRFTQSFDSALLAQAETLEVILPYWESSGLKHVFTARLK